MIADPPLFDDLVRLFFEEHSVRTDLEDVGRPRCHTVIVSTGSTTLVLVRDETAIATTEAVDLSRQPKSGTGEHPARPLALLFFGLSKLFVERSPCIDRGIRDPNLLNLFEVEQPLAVRKRVEGHDADERIGVLFHLPSLL